MGGATLSAYVSLAVMIGACVLGRVLETSLYGTFGCGLLGLAALLSWILCGFSVQAVVTLVAGAAGAGIMFWFFYDAV